MTTGDMTTGDRYRHPSVLISAPWGADMSISGCRYRHPSIPIEHAFLQVRALRRLRTLHTKEGTRKETHRRGSPAVLAQALRSSGCPSGPSNRLNLCPLPPWAVTQRGRGRMSVRRHTRANAGTCTYRCGGLSMAEVRTLVVLGSRPVLAVLGVGLLPLDARPEGRRPQSPCAGARSRTSGLDYHAVIIVGCSSSSSWLLKWNGSCMQPPRHLALGSGVRRRRPGARAVIAVRRRGRTCGSRRRRSARWSARRTAYARPL